MKLSTKIKHTLTYSISHNRCFLDSQAPSYMIHLSDQTVTLPPSPPPPTGKANSATVLSLRSGRVFLFTHLYSCSYFTIIIFCEILKKTPSSPSPFHSPLAQVLLKNQAHPFPLSHPWSFCWLFLSSSELSSKDDKWPFVTNVVPRQ